MKSLFRIISFFSILCFIFFCILCKKSYPPGGNQENIIEIELKYSFPEEELEKEEIFLASPRFIEVDDLGNIYVSDQRMHRILKFSPEGNFLDQYGRHGEGPGEMQTPSDLIVTKDHIIVKEIPRIQFLDRTGNYVSSFKNFKGYHKIAHHPNGSIFALPLISRPEFKLVDLLSREGEVIHSFGEILKYEESLVPLNYCYPAVDQNYLYLAFRHFSIVRKYSLSGALLEEFRFDNDTMIEKEKKNNEVYQLVKRGKSRRIFATVIQSVRAKKKGFYLLHINEYFEILEFDNNGKLIASYRSKLLDEYFPIEFIVKEDGNSKLFYLLQVSPSSKIDVFRPKKAN